MAETQRRAARHYELHEVHEGALRLDLGLRAESESFDDAVEAAFVYLEEHDPARDGKVKALEIVEVNGGERGTVWLYSSSSAGVASSDLVGRWGFDVTRPWRGPQFRVDTSHSKE
jgi:hypothetical protein